MNGEVTAKDEISAVLDLLNRIAAVEIDCLSIRLGEFRSQHEGRVIQPLVDNVGAEAVGGCLQGCGIGDG
ncbi:MAG TPA: hypothetical protein VJX67_04285 [Blastocatellia bacterium]|nr:hypothetical protein [Blastocatellia bacterium]